MHLHWRTSTFLYHLFLVSGSVRQAEADVDADVWMLMCAPSGGRCPERCLRAQLQRAASTGCAELGRRICAAMQATYEYSYTLPAVPPAANMNGPVAGWGACLPAQRGQEAAPMAWVPCMAGDTQPLCSRGTKGQVVAMINVHAVTSRLPKMRLALSKTRAHRVAAFLPSFIPQ